MLSRGALPGPLERVDIALPLVMSVSSAKNMFLVKDGGWTCKGSFLFSTLNMLKVGVGEGGDEFLVRCAGVLVTSGKDLGMGIGKGGTIAGLPWPGLTVCLVFSSIDNFGVELPKKVVCVAGFGLAGPLVGVCQSSRLLAEAELLEFLLRLVEVFFVSVDSPLVLALSPFRWEKAVEAVGNESVALRYSSWLPAVLVLVASAVGWPCWPRWPLVLKLEDPIGFS